MKVAMLHEVKPLENEALRTTMDFLKDEIKSLNGSLTYIRADEIPSLDEGVVSRLTDLDDYYCLSLGAEKKYFCVGHHEGLGLARLVAKRIQEFRRSYTRKRLLKVESGIVEKTLEVAEQVIGRDMSLDFWQTFSLFDATLVHFGVWVYAHEGDDLRTLRLKWEGVETHLSYDWKGLRMMADYTLAVIREKSNDDVRKRVTELLAESVMACCCNVGSRLYCVGFDLVYAIPMGYRVEVLYISDESQPEDLVKLIETYHSNQMETSLDAKPGARLLNSLLQGLL